MAARNFVQFARGDFGRDAAGGARAKLLRGVSRRTNESTPPRSGCATASEADVHAGRIPGEANGRLSQPRIEGASHCAWPLPPESDHGNGLRRGDFEAARAAI